MNCMEAHLLIPTCSGSTRSQFAPGKRSSGCPTQPTASPIQMTAHATRPIPLTASLPIPLTASLPIQITASLPYKSLSALPHQLLLGTGVLVQAQRSSRIPTSTIFQYRPQRKSTRRLILPVHEMSLSFRYSTVHLQTADNMTRKPPRRLTLHKS